MWAQFANTCVGIWLMAAPAVLQYGEPARSHDQIAGPVVATFACVAIWEATRMARWVNLPIGVWMLAAPWVLSYGVTDATVNSMVTGVLIAALSLPRGKLKHRFDGGWSMVWKGVGLRRPDL